MNTSNQNMEKSLCENCGRRQGAPAYFFYGTKKKDERGEVQGSAFAVVCATCALNYRGKLFVMGSLSALGIALIGLIFGVIFPLTWLLTAFYGIKFLIGFIILLILSPQSLAELRAQEIQRVPTGVDAHSWSPSEYSKEFKVQLPHDMTWRPPMQPKAQRTWLYSLATLMLGIVLFCSGIFIPLEYSPYDVLSLLVGIPVFTGGVFWLYHAINLLRIPTQTTPLPKLKEYDSQKTETFSQLVNEQILTTQPAVYQQATHIQPAIAASNKSPIGATVLSFFLLGGAGQIYLGQWKKGLALMISSFLLSFVFIGIIIQIIGIGDTYGVAQKLQNGNSVEEWEFNINWKVAGLVTLIYAIAICGIVALAPSSPAR